MDGDRARILAELDAEIRSCTRCGLAAGRRRAVPGEGSPAASLVFVGEAPGGAEDRLGRPFVGPAGQLLNELLTTIGLRRAETYITNVVKCRPPGNRDPMLSEIESCQDYLLGQVATIMPRVVCPLGRFALTTLLGDQLSISRVHGHSYRRGGILYMPLYHPAAALHNDDLRETLFGDFEKLGRFLADQAAVG
jgi:uracil-DNA glycosylase family 4